MIVWILYFGYGIYKFRNSSNEYKVNLKLSSDEEKIVDGALELVTKLYFSKDNEEFIKNLSDNEIRVINNWFANTKESDSDIFQSVKIEDFEKMLYLSSNLYYDKNGDPTEEHKKATETYNKIKNIANNLLQNNNLLINGANNKNFESNCLKLLGKPLFLVTYYSLAFYPQWFDDENQISPQDEIKINPSDYWNDTAINPNDENKISPNFYGMYIALRKRWIKKCQKIKENGLEIPTKSEIFSCENNNFLTGDYGYDRYYTTGSQNHFKNDEIS